MAETPPTLGKWYPLAHNVVFLFGVLPQAIKLFGMRGIPWTQVWGAMYLSPFLVLAGAGALARCVEDDIEKPEHRARESLNGERVTMLQVAAAAQVTMWVWCVWELLRPPWSMHMQNGPPILYSILVVPGLLIMFPACLTLLLSAALISLDLAMLYPRAPTILGKAACLLLFVPFAFLCFYSIPDYAKFVLMNDSIAISLYLWIPVVNVTHMVSPYRLLIFFGMANLVLSVLYYRFRYDPTGTIMPIWAGGLG